MSLNTLVDIKALSCSLRKEWLHCLCDEQDTPSWGGGKWRTEVWSELLKVIRRVMVDPGWIPGPLGPVLGLFVSSHAGACLWEETRILRAPHGPSWQKVPLWRFCTLDCVMCFLASFTDQTQTRVSLPWSQAFVLPISRLLFPIHWNN